MRFLTRCTSCDTLFKVVADQLKVSQGWVRCGQCGAVFDAQSHLLEQAPQTADAAHTEPAARSTQMSDRAPPPDNIPVNLHAEPDSADAASVSHLPHETPSFISQAQRAKRWRAPWVRAGLHALACALLGSLLVQIIYGGKDRIAANFPSFAPHLQKICRISGCTIEPLRGIDVIAVDASQFNLIAQNSAQPNTAGALYGLSLSLKNRGTVPVAMPHIELSLQDSQDQVIVRRIFAPAELGISAATLLPSQDTAASATLQVSTRTFAAPASSIQGYRVLAFYP